MSSGELSDPDPPPSYASIEMSYSSAQALSEIDGSSSVGTTDMLYWETSHEGRHPLRPAPPLALHRAPTPTPISSIPELARVNFVDNYGEGVVCPYDDMGINLWLRNERDPRFGVEAIEDPYTFNHDGLWRVSESAIRNHDLDFAPPSPGVRPMASFNSALLRNFALQSDLRDPAYEWPIGATAPTPPRMSSPFPEYPDSSPMKSVHREGEPGLSFSTVKTPYYIYQGLPADDAEKQPDADGYEETAEEMYEGEEENDWDRFADPKGKKTAF